MGRQLLQVTYSTSTAWFLCATYWQRADPVIETGTRQDWLLNDMTLAIYDGDDLTPLRDGDLFGSLSTNGVGRSAGYLKFAKERWRSCFGRGVTGSRRSLQRIRLHAWPVPLFEPKGRGSLALISTTKFEDICGRRLRIPPPVAARST